ncbi:MAG: winged helix-turn-helix domain-containing tetratricopeptide repeat protein [Devosia sp.]
MGTGQISFGPFVLDRSAQSLLSGGKPIALGQRGYALLDALASADGNVSKADLIEAAWPGTIVEDGNLTVQIAALRKALGTRPDGQEWIVTAPRVGYRLLRELPSAAAEPSAVPAVAVLPFQNLGGDPEQDYFADGMVEDIITALSRFKSFAVIARSSSFAYKGRTTDVRRVAAELGVRYVLEGSVRRAGERLRITAQLAEGGTGTQIWAQQFDGPVNDVFEFQDRIVEAIVGIVEPQIQELELERARRKRPEDITAYELYLQALQKFTSTTNDDNISGYGLIVRAVEREPNNGTYLALAADFLQHRYGMGWPPIGPDDFDGARDFANRALVNAPDDPAVAARAGNVLLQHCREYDRGLAIVRRAVKLNPYNFFVAALTAVCELHCGDLDVARELFERSARLNPAATGAFFPLTGIAHVEMARGNFEEALVFAERSYALSTVFDACLWMLASANAHLGRMDEARRYCAELLRLSPRATISSIRAGQPAKIPQRIETVLAGLKLAGLPEK